MVIRYCISEWKYAEQDLMQIKNTCSSSNRLINRLLVTSKMPMNNMCWYDVQVGVGSYWPKVRAECL